VQRASDERPPAILRAPRLRPPTRMPVWCTDLNSVCYNSVTEHRQMFCVAVPAGGFGTVWLTVHLTAKNGYIPWTGLTQAKWLTVRVDSKHAGLALTV
jgi:hypothetical protein